MNKHVIMVLLLFGLLIGGLLIASCAGDTTTITSTQTTTVSSFTRDTQTTTITTTVTGTGGPTTITITREPPVIPHAYLVEIPGVVYQGGEEPICFECHPIPASHTDGRLLDETICDECHTVSDNPILLQ
jgi:hypothetical protein